MRSQPRLIAALRLETTPRPRADAPGPYQLRRLWAAMACRVRWRLLVVASRDLEPDTARALLARDYRGRVTIVDAKTGSPRTTFDIERLARLCTKEGQLRFAPYESRPERPPAGEAKPVDVPVPNDIY